MLPVIKSFLCRRFFCLNFCLFLLYKIYCSFGSWFCKHLRWKGNLMFYFGLWPGQKCHSKVMHRKEVTHSNGSYERKSRGWKLADEMRRAKKFPWYTHRLTHRKRVTCELHDSYFRLMTIKHTKDRVGDRVDVELLYNSVKTEVKTVPVRVGVGGRRDVVGKATPGRRGLGPWWVEVRRRCW